MISNRQVRQSLSICNLETGKLVGVSPVPPDRNGFANAGSVASMAFSRDGSELAVLFGRGGENRLVCWNMTTGKVERDLNPFKPDLGMGVPEGGALVEFLPDGKAVRVHHSLYELATGNLLATIPAEASIANLVAAMQMLSENRALVAIEPSMQLTALSLETQVIDR
jgi:hypothetical protein